MIYRRSVERFERVAKYYKTKHLFKNWYLVKDKGFFGLWHLWIVDDKYKDYLERHADHLEKLHGLTNS